MANSNRTPDTIEIQLTKGYVTIVDAVDADLVAHCWSASVDTRSDGTIYTRALRFAFTGALRKGVYLHREILSRKVGRDLTAAEMADHINGDTLDNRRDNLRVATNSQNQMNKGVQPNTTSNLKGVHWISAKKRWRALITLEGKQTYLGLFKTEEEAHAAYCEAARRIFGEFARFE
jgi:hypothetical protein